MASNIFEDFCFDFYDTIKKYTNEEIEYIAKFNKSIFNRNKKKYIFSKEISEKKDTILDNKFSYGYSKKEWLTDFVKPYLHFLRTVEKCFMYNNDESNTVYSEIINDKEIIYFAVNDSYKIRIIFEKTKIPDKLIKDPDLDNIFDNNYMEFITIEVKRNFGKQMMNKFKIITDNDTFDDETDEFLLEIIMDVIYTSILSQLSDILNFIINTYTDLNIKINDKLKIYEKRGIDYYDIS